MTRFILTEAYRLLTIGMALSGFVGALVIAMAFAS